MINSSTINNRQNEDQYLKIQYASKKCFNSAEKMNYLSWMLCILSALMIFVPDGTAKYISLGIPILLEVAAFITDRLINRKLTNAARLRNYFDSQVLLINEDSYSDIDKQKLKELSLNISQKNKSEADINLRNTGRDKPPGVRNWYEFKREITGISAQYECQSQNVWWNKKMVNNRLVILPIVFVCLVIIFIVMFIFFKTDIWNIIACSIGIILKIVERIVEHYNYHVISIKIDTIQNHIQNQLTTNNVQELQKLIDERRSIPVLEINFIHRIKAKKYSSSYEDIS